MDTLQIGKQGVTDEWLVEAKLRLIKHRKLKVKMLKSSLSKQDRKSWAKDVAEKLGASLEEVRGNTFILAK